MTCGNCRWLHDSEGGNAAGGSSIEGIAPSAICRPFDAAWCVSDVILMY